MNIGKTNKNSLDQLADRAREFYIGLNEVNKIKYGQRIEDILNSVQDLNDKSKPTKYILSIFIKYRDELEKISQEINEIKHQ